MTSRCTEYSVLSATLLPQRFDANGVTGLPQVAATRGQFEIETAAGAGRAFDSNIAAVLAHDFLADRKAQARAARSFFRFEDREDSLDVIRSDAFAVVGDDDMDKLVAG